MLETIQLYGNYLYLIGIFDIQLLYAKKLLKTAAQKM